MDKDYLLQNVQIGLLSRHFGYFSRLKRPGALTFATNLHLMPSLRMRGDVLRLDAYALMA